MCRSIHIREIVHQRQRLDSEWMIGIVRAAFGTTLTMSGFNMTVSTIESTTDFVEEDDEFKIYRKFITVRLIIEQT